MLEPFFRSVTVFVCQTCLPVPASRQTSSPEVFAENTYSPRKQAVEVLLRILLVTSFRGAAAEILPVVGRSSGISTPHPNLLPDRGGERRENAPASLRTALRTKSTSACVGKTDYILANADFAWAVICCSVRSCLCVAIDH